MNSPCVNCGADSRVCKECEWYTGGWISEDQYEAILKAEKLDLLKDLLSEIEEYKLNYLGSGEEITQAYADGLWKGCRFIQQKINALEGTEIHKEQTDGTENNI